MPARLKAFGQALFLMQSRATDKKKAEKLSKKIVS
jgi:hypothetical protein